MEHEVLELWQRHDVFRRSLDATRNAPPYIFYDGPPFATGLPHHGHLVASVLKDVVPRYWTMNGRHVLRRFGWDCHGLPIELDRQIPRHVGQRGGGQAGRWRLQRAVPRHRRAPCGRVAPHHHPPRPLGGFRRRLQDHGRLLHGVRLVGGQAALEQGLRLSRLQGDAGFPGLGNGVGQFRGRPELHGRARPGRHRAVSPHGRGRALGGMDHNAVDAAFQLGGLRGRGHGLCESGGRGRRQNALSRRGAPARLPKETPALAGDEALERGADRGPPLPAAVRLLHRRARTRRVCGGGGRLRHRRRRHRPSPPSAGVRRRRPSGAARRRHQRAGLPGHDGGSVHEGSAGFRRPFRQRGGRRHHSRLGRRRRAVRPRRDRSQLPALLPHGQTPHLPRRAVVVRARVGLPRGLGGRQRTGVVGAGTHQTRAFRQLAGRCHGLGDFPQPRVGHAPAHLDQLQNRQSPLRRFGGRTGSAHRHPRGGLAPRTRGPAHLHGGRRGRRVPARGRGAGLLVRVRRHALRAIALPVREPRHFRARLSCGIHRRRARPNARLVLHVDGARHRAVQQTRVPQRHRQRLGACRRRQEDVQEPAQLHASGRFDGSLRRRRPAPASHQLRLGARRGTALRGPRRARHGAPRVAALAQCVDVSGNLCPYRRLAPLGGNAL